MSSRSIEFVVPSGNYGHVLLMWKMGEQIRKLCSDPPKKISWNISGSANGKFTYEFRWKTIEVRDAIISTLIMNNCEILTVPYNIFSI